jgi:hypothetical protein
MKVLLDEKEMFEGCRLFLREDVEHREMGFSHLIGFKAKQNQVTMRRLKQRVAEKFGSYLEKIVEMAQAELWQNPLLP